MKILNRTSTDGKHLAYPENALRLHTPRLEAIQWDNGDVTIDTGRTTLTLTSAQLRVLDAARAQMVIQ